MKTTLELPADVAHVLRMESAKRGGRKAASLSKLVSEAVRKMYGTPASSRGVGRQTPGRVVIAAAPDAPKLTATMIHAALNDETP